MQFNKLLVVDDSDTTRIMIRTYLKGLGFRIVEEADNGDTAVKAVEGALKNKAPYDLIFVDVNMPKVNGIQFVEYIKKTLGDSRPHMIMITGEAEKESVLRGLRAGVDAYLLKPVSPASLKAAIDKLLAKTTA